MTNNPSKSILTGFTNTQPQTQEDSKVQNKKVSKIFSNFNYKIMFLTFETFNVLSLGIKYMYLIFFAV